MAGIDKEMKHARALQLRAEGWSFVQIAEELGYAGGSGAYAAVKSALAEIREEAVDDIKTTALEKLNIILRAQMKKAIQGDTKAADCCTRIIQRQANMLGLDAPSKVAPTNPDGTEPYNLSALSDEEIQALRAIAGKMAKDEKK